MADFHAKYEAARSTALNQALWSQADGFAPNVANDPAVRDRLRRRSRYEDDNNPSYSGLVSDRSNETIGTGPRLQITIGATDTEAAAVHELEVLWRDGAENTALLDKLLLMDISETREGEVFGLLYTNPKLPADAPQVDMKVYEADQCGTPDLDYSDPDAVDGIRFDPWGNPTEYHFLRRHPGDHYAANLSRAYDRFPAARVVHFFKPRRAGQARGVPAMQPSFPLHGMRRQYALATLQTAQLQAQFSGVIEDTRAIPGDEVEEEQAQEPREVPIGNSTFLELTGGKTAKAFDANQPTTGYRDFAADISTEAGRPINAPRNISTGSSAEYNYSSGRLDAAQWQRAIRIRRKRFERIVLNALFWAWLREARLLPGYLPAGLPDLNKLKWCWRWDGFVSIDPVKDANAAEIGLRSGTTTLDKICGEQGEDWAEVLEQQARELALRKKLGLLPEPAPVPPPARARGAEDEDEEMESVQYGGSRYAR